MMTTLFYTLKSLASILEIPTAYSSVVTAQSATIVLI